VAKFLIQFIFGEKEEKKQGRAWEKNKENKFLEKRRRGKKSFLLKKSTDKYTPQRGQTPPHPHISHSLFLFDKQIPNRQIYLPLRYGSHKTDRSQGCRWKGSKEESTSNERRKTGREEDAATHQETAQVSPRYKKKR
jgi:hypothetical protein